MAALGWDPCLEAPLDVTPGTHLPGFHLFNANTDRLNHVLPIHVLNHPGERLGVLDHKAALPLTVRSSGRPVFLRRAMAALVFR